MDFCRLHSRRICEIQTTQGQLLWDFVDKSVKWMPIKEEEEVYKYNTHIDDMYKNQIIEFVNCIDNDIIPKININDGIEVMNMIDLCIKSNLSGNSVNI